jgi:3-methyladenine DNA glycosylase AlkD
MDRLPSWSTPKRPSRSRAESSKPREEWDVRQIVGILERLGRRKNVRGMARYGIHAKNVFGVSKPKLDELARRIGKNHALALKLWGTGNHDARILAGLVGERSLVTADQMNRWVRGFDNWDVSDGTCCHLFVFAKPAWSKAFEWAGRKREFEKRAGFALAAYLAIHDKAAPDTPYLRFLEKIEREAWDERNFVKKAVNWALRNIGKRNLRLNRAAIQSAKRIRKSPLPAARWIAADALRELQGKAVQARLARAKT